MSEIWVRNVKFVSFLDMLFRWVEQDPDSLFDGVVDCLRHICPKSVSETKVAITNQRETVIAVERSTGRPLYNAISWMDVRTSAICRDFSQRTKSHEVERLSGLKFSPFFSVFKMLWLLENVDNVKEAASRNDLLFCTVDCWILKVRSG